MGYKNFDVAVYFTANDIDAVNSINDLEKDFGILEKYLKCSKVYLETFRCDFFADEDKILEVKRFFDNKGIKTSGGIMLAMANLNSASGFRGFCYTNGLYLKKLKDIVEYTARLFDEIILDDFYFTNCKCESCINAKGDMSWADFRMKLLTEVSQNSIIKTAKQINPDVNIIIKYPNWYEHFHSTGYNLEDQPKQFDMIYTGTETRDPENTQQDLQRYLSYFLMRYMENVKPGKNGGGWFDPLDCFSNIGYFVEQAHLTLFSKPKEITMFCYGIMKDIIFTPMAGYIFDKFDRYYSLLGNPTGVSCYKPYHSSGEDYLFNYIGMLGIPLEPTPVFPEESSIVLLTASAVKDANIVDKIKRHLIKGKTVVITSGLLKVLEDRGIDDVVQLKCTDRKALVDKFASEPFECGYKYYCHSDKKIMLTQVEYSTNDCWSTVAAIGENNTFPVLLETQYGKGNLYLITIPDNYGDLYNLPKEVLNPIRSILTKDLYVTLDCGSKIGLFVYDNGVFIVESFLPTNVVFNIVINRQNVKLIELATGNELEGNVLGGKTVFSVAFRPTTYQVYRCEPV